MPTPRHIHDAGPGAQALRYAVLLLVAVAFAAPLV